MQNEKIRERSDEECTHSSLFGGLGSVRSFGWERVSSCVGIFFIALRCSGYRFLADCAGVMVYGWDADLRKLLYG